MLADSHVVIHRSHSNTHQCYHTFRLAHTCWPTLIHTYTVTCTHCHKHSEPLTHSCWPIAPRRGVWETPPALTPTDTQTNAHTDWRPMVTSQQTLGLLTHSLRSPHGKKWKHTHHTGWQAPQSLGKMHSIHSVSSPSDLQRPGVAGHHLSEAGWGEGFLSS